MRTRLKRDPELILSLTIWPIIRSFGHTFDCIEKSRSISQLCARFDPESGKQVHTYPLEWWNEKAVRFLHLARFARRFLCIPATSASSDRVFSTAGVTITKARASLTPENAENLIFLQDAIPIMDELIE